MELWLHQSVDQAAMDISAAGVMTKVGAQVAVCQQMSVQVYM